MQIFSTLRTVFTPSPAATFLSPISWREIDTPQKLIECYASISSEELNQHLNQDSDNHPFKKLMSWNATLDDYRAFLNLPIVQRTEALWSNKEGKSLFFIACSRRNPVAAEAALECIPRVIWEPFRDLLLDSTRLPLYFMDEDCWTNVFVKIIDLIPRWHEPHAKAILKFALLKTDSPVLIQKIREKISPTLVNTLKDVVLDLHIEGPTIAKWSDDKLQLLLDLGINPIELVIKNSRFFSLKELDLLFNPPSSMFDRPAFQAFLCRPFIQSNPTMWVGVKSDDKPSTYSLLTAVIKFIREDLAETLIDYCPKTCLMQLLTNTASSEDDPLVLATQKGFAKLLSKIIDLYPKDQERKWYSARDTEERGDRKSILHTVLTNREDFFQVDENGQARSKVVLKTILTKANSDALAQMYASDNPIETILGRNEKHLPMILKYCPTSKLEEYSIEFWQTMWQRVLWEKNSEFMEIMVEVCPRQKLTEMLNSWLSERYFLRNQEGLVLEPLIRKFTKDFTDREAKLLALLWVCNTDEDIEQSLIQIKKRLKEANVAESS